MCVFKVHVTDQSSAPVGQAFVMIRSVQGRPLTSGETSGDGTVARKLPPGTYRVAVDHAGFDNFLASEVTVACPDPSQPATFAAKLKIRECFVDECQPELTPVRSDLNQPLELSGKKN
jgi:hypothetical protein